VPITVTEATLGRKSSATVDGPFAPARSSRDEQRAEVEAARKGRAFSSDPATAGPIYRTASQGAKPADERVRSLKELAKIAPEDPRKDLFDRAGVRSLAIDARKPKRKKARAGYNISAVAELYKLHPQTLRPTTSGLLQAAGPMETRGFTPTPTWNGWK